MRLVIWCDVIYGWLEDEDNRVANSYNVWKSSKVLRSDKNFISGLKKQKNDTTDCKTDLDLGSKLIIIESILTTLNWALFLEATGKVV